MKPAKGLLLFATWLMRLAIVFFAFITFFDALKGFQFKTIQFYVALVYILFSVLLFIGGFLSKPGFTVFSGLMLFLVSVYEIIMKFSDGINSELTYFLLVATVSLYFVTAGNKN